MMKKLLLLTTFFIWVATHLSYAQNRDMPWAVGFNFAWIDAQGGVKTPMFRTRDNWNQAAQVTVSRFIIPSVNVFASTIVAEVGKPVNRFDKNISFFNLDLGAQYNFANGYILKENHWFNPFIYAGAGLNTLRSKNYFFYNGGVGINFWLKEFFAITVQTSYNGVEQFKDMNQYWNHALGVKFRIGNVLDTDGDGIIDKLDECPEVKGTEALKGCPDTDGDGIVDKEDECPEAPGLPALKGCPDSDSDGIADKEDECPDQKGTPEMKGCPDSDSDGIADKNDECPSQKGTPELKGCPDSDSDGIADKNDECPNQAGLAQFKGCPDTDGDGVPDNKDKCPNVKGLVSNDGCPAIEEEKKKEVEAKLAMSAKQINFETGSAIITKASYPELDAIVALMQQYPAATFRVEGHTDNVGDAARNKTLSQQRADAVKSYFVSKGVSSSRITSEGFGQDKPIQSNATAAGRAANRRVEIHVNQ